MGRAPLSVAGRVAQRPARYPYPIVPVPGHGHGIDRIITPAEHIYAGIETITVSQCQAFHTNDTMATTSSVVSAW